MEEREWEREKRRREEWNGTGNMLATFEHQKGHFRCILFALKKKKRSKSGNYEKAKFSYLTSLAKVTLLLLKVFKKKLENLSQDWLEDAFVLVDLDQITVFQTLICTWNTHETCRVLPKGLGCSLRLSISNKLPGDAHATLLWNILWVVRDQMILEVPSHCKYEHFLSQVVK